MSYRVIQRFVDLQDDKHRYEVGDEFPRLGLKVSKARVEELSTNKNRRGIPLIEEVAESEEVEELEEKPATESKPKPKPKKKAKPKKKEE